MQVNGKVRARLEVPAGIDAEKVCMMAPHENVARFVADKRIVKQVYVPDKLLNIVVR